MHISGWETEPIKGRIETNVRETGKGFLNASYGIKNLWKS